MKTPARKRKRELKRFVGFSLIIFVVLAFLAGGIYYLIAVKFKKPLYISPLSGVKDSQEPRVEDSVDLIKKVLKQKKINVLSVTIASDSAYRAQLKDGGIVTFSSKKDILNQISSLQFILARLTMEGKLFSQLDLRFEKPVIIFRE